MTKRHDSSNMTGRRFGRLVCTAPRRQTRQPVHCDCGTDKIVNYSQLLNGRVASCGCTRRIASPFLKRSKVGALTIGAPVVHNDGGWYDFTCDCGTKLQAPLRSTKLSLVYACPTCEAANEDALFHTAEATRRMKAFNVNPTAQRILAAKIARDVERRAEIRSSLDEAMRDALYGD